MTFWLAEHAGQEETHVLQADFEFRVREAIDRIDQRMATYEQVLRGTKGLFISSDYVSAEEFRTYVAALGLEEHYPGIQGIAIVQVVAPADKQKHIAAIRAEGMPDYTIHPAGERRLYTSIVRIEPLNDTNQRAIGYDMLTEPMRRDAMLRARDTGKAAASGKLHLIQEAGKNQQWGFVMYLPVYRYGMPTATVGQRRAALSGWIGGPFRIRDLMAGIGGERSNDINLRIYDGKKISPNALFYDSTEPKPNQGEYRPLFQSVKQIDIAGRPWTVEISSTPSYEVPVRGGRASLISLVGSGIGILLALLIWLLASGRARALALANKMTENLRESEKWLKLALDAANLGVVDWDLKNDIATRSIRHDQIFGHQTPLAEWHLQTYLDHVPPEDRDAVLKKIEACWKEGDIDIAIRIVQPGGRLRWVAMRGTVMYNQAGEPVRQIGTVADITKLKSAEEHARKARGELEERVKQRTAALVQSNELLMTEIQEREKVEAALFNSRKRLSLIFDTVAEGLIVHDQDGNIIERNAAANRILGLPSGSAGKLRLENFIRTIHEDGTPFGVESHPALVSLRTGRPAHDVVMGVYKPSGDLTWISVSTEPQLDEQGRVQMVVTSFSDITRKKESEELIWMQANYDSLTGLPNRRLFQDHLEQEIKKADRSKLPLALMFLDLDRFKDINDTLGHDTGDTLLQEAARRLSCCVRDSDTVARLGGDEFTVILSELHDVTDVVHIAQNIQKKMAEPFELGIETVHVSASIGITLYPDDAGEIDTLLKNADQAMYAAKNRGRNCYQYFTKSMQEIAQARMWLASELRSAVAGRHFNMLYQPIVDLTTGTIGKAEALIRWQHPTRGLIDPSMFIPIAEETGLIVDIGDWVLHEVADQAKHWHAHHHPGIQISVNNSPVQFHQKGHSYQNWLRYLKEIGLPGQAIALEITEGLLLDASANVSDLLLEFRDAGVNVSLDDFGTGYSSLAYLKKFDIDMLKIDKSFIQNLSPDSDDLALCEAIIVMAHKLNVKVVAEGVETKQQCELLKKAGCDYGQGFLFSKPVPAEEFIV